MIIRLYKKDDDNVLGTINTAGRTPTASGVGEQLLDAWVKANKDVAKADATRDLESYFSSWKTIDEYSQVKDNPNTETTK